MSVSLVSEVCGAEFGDQRLTQRLGKVIEALGHKPNLSIPAATPARAEMEAAYRFFDNDKVAPDKILHPHQQATRQRISQNDLVLLVQDTTEIDLTRPQRQVRGVGPIGRGSRSGAYLHLLQAFDADGLPLGLVWQKSWAREKTSTTSQNEKHRRRKQTPIEEKESLRWLEGIRATREVAETCPETTCVCMGDSEADIYELFSEPRVTDQGECHLLIRGCQPRATTDQSNWLEKARASKCLYTCSVDVSSRTPKITATAELRQRKQAREARIAEVEVRATRVALRPPYRCGRKLPVVEVNVVLVEEASPPEGCPAIQWLLVTTLPIDGLQQVQTIVKAYCVRWQIEIFFRTIKTGCRVEDRQFETLQRLQNCLAVYCIIAWRVMYLCRLGRECPDLDCEIVFEPCEWKSVYMAVKRKAPPATPLPLSEVVRMIASLGGYVIRKSTQPGPQTLWIGLQRVRDLSTAWNAFGPGS